MKTKLSLGSLRLLVPWLLSASSICSLALLGALLNQPSRAAAYSSPIAISTDDRLIWAVNPRDNTVSVIRPDSLEVLAEIAVGRQPQSVAITPDKKWVYVANAADNSVAVIRIDTGAWTSFAATVDTSVGLNGQLITGAEPFAVACSPDGKRVFVANRQQDTVTVINAETRTIIGHVDLRNSLANDPDRRRHFQPGGLGVTPDNRRLYVSRFLSFTKPGGRQGEDQGKEGLVAVLDINTSSADLADYKVARVVTLAPQATGFTIPGISNATEAVTFAYPNQLNAVVVRGDYAYLPNIGASPNGPLRFNLDTHAFVNLIGGVNGDQPSDLGALNLHLGARDPEAGRRRLFFANPWAIAFTSQTGPGSGYVVSAASDLLVKVNVGEDGRLTFTGDENTTRYLDLNDPDNPLTSGRNAGKNPQGIVITSDATRAYVNNFGSKNVTVVDLTTDTIIKVIPLRPLPTPGSLQEKILVGAEVFFSSRGNFDPVPGATVSLRDRLSSEGWQSCASCHPHGLTDGVVWQFNSGPRKSVQMNGTFNPIHPDRQRVLNYSAVFDEVEDFEINVRNVSGPGNLPNTTPPQLDPNHGLLIGDDGNVNAAPGALNGFAKANADRPQLSVTLPGSAVSVPALTGLREWFRHAIRTPSGPLPGYGGAGADLAQIGEGRKLFEQVGCVTCHGGSQWTISFKDFASPPSSADIFTETTPAATSGTPVGVQYLNRFLRDAATFNLGVAGGGNEFGKNIGAIEKAAPTVANGVLVPGLDALGKDYNGDGAGNGFNVPSLLGVFAMQPYNHNGAAESIAEILTDPRHWQHSGGDSSILNDPAKQAALTAFIESIDAQTPIFNIPGEPLFITDVAKGPTQSTIDWLGGTGPFALQKKQALDEAYFVTVATTPERRAADPDPSSAVFYRIFDLDHAPTVWLNLALRGDSVRPNPIDSSARGFGYLRVKGNTLSFTITSQGLSGPATAVRLQGPAGAAEVGATLLDLTPFRGVATGNAGTWIGATPITAEQKAHILGHQTYVEILTAANPAGEIRGQAVTAVLKASLSGAAERPAPVVTPANGFGIFTLVGQELSFNINYQGLSGPATAAHIHGPARESQTAAPLIDLKDYAVGGFGTSGAIIGTVTLDERQLAAISDGLTYANIHTVANPGGEIRGQVTVHNTATPFSAALTGAAVRPAPVDSLATGFASVGLNGHQMTFHLVYRGLSGPATAAQIRGPAPTSASAGILLDLAPFHTGPFGLEGEFSGAVELSDEWRLNLLNADTYINIATTRNPDGEVRGQIAPILLDAVMRGANERPNPVASDALGSARLALLGRTLSFQIDYAGLSGDATLAHLHGPAGPDQTASPLIDLRPFALNGFGQLGFIVGSIQTQPNELDTIVDGLGYLNVHTAANSGGEIRGQVRAVIDPGTAPVDPGAVIDAHTAALNAGQLEAALALVADDAVFDRPLPTGVLTGKAAIRSYLQDLIAHKPQIQLIGLHTVDGENVRWKTRTSQINGADPSQIQVSLNDSSAIVRNGLIIQHTTRPLQ
ncbi:MAG: CHRD domain-containing protein [Verrucomicrobiota bacterium]